MSRPSVSDSKLVPQVLAGDASAFAKLIEKYAGTLSAATFRILHHAEDSRDVIQEALFIAYRDLPSLSEPGKFGAWVRGIALNLARKRLEEREHRHTFYQRLPRRSVTKDEVIELAANQERRKELLRAIDSLDEVRREIVLLHYVGGDSIEQVAGMLGRPVGSVKRMLSEARGVLRKELIDMAREEFAEFRLSKEQRQRLAKIGEFPHNEPKIVVRKLDDKAPRTRTVTADVTFAELRPGAEACSADYEYPGRRLTGLNHDVTEGPIEMDGRPAFRVNNIQFSPDRKACFTIKCQIL